MPRAQANAHGGTTRAGMAKRTWTADGPTPEVRAGETVQCVKCDWNSDATWMASAAARNPDGTHATYSYENRASECPSCAAWGTLEVGRPTDPVQRRLGRTKNWTPGWNPLFTLPAALGLSPLDVLLLMYLETHRRTANDPAWPKHKTIATAVGRSTSTIKRTLAGLVERGFLEAHERRQRDGKLGTIRYTRKGLTRVMDHIADNELHGRDPARGLPQLLRELRRPEPTHDLRPSVSPGETDKQADQRAPVNETRAQNGRRPGSTSALAKENVVEEKAFKEKGRGARANLAEVRGEPAALAAVDAAVADGTLVEITNGEPPSSPTLILDYTGLYP